ncbi:MAG: cytochrome P450 [Sporichthyaceae bacterium]
MREPGVISITEAFGGVRPINEAMDEFVAAGHEVMVDRDGGGALFLRADDCERLLTERGFTAVAMPVLAMSGVVDGPLYDLWSVLMFGKDGEEHRRIRGAASHWFTPAAVAARSDGAAALAAELAEILPTSGEFDLWADFALPLAGRSICGLVGIPDWARATEWALDLVAAFGFLSPEARVRAEKAAAEFCAYLDDLLAEPHRIAPGTIAAALLAGDAKELSPAETRGLIANMTFGGLEAIAKVLTTGVAHLLDHGLWSDLVADPALAASAADELVRFDPPLAATVRLTAEPLECRGVAMPPGQFVFPSLRAACRDPELFDDPESLRLRRRPGKPFAYGAGAHFCLGMHLARQVVAEGLAALARSHPSLTLAVDRADVPWGGSLFYGVERLPLRG